MVGDGTCVRFVLCVVSNLYNWRQEEYVTYDVVGWCPNAYVDMLMCDWCVLLYLLSLCMGLSLRHSNDCL